MLPQDYGYIVSGVHGSGIQAFRYFLQISELSPMYWDLIGSDREGVDCLNDYKKDFSPYFNDKKTWGIFLDRVYDDYTVKRLQELQTKVLHFILIRDPISLIKSGVNELINDYVVRNVFRKDLTQPKTGDSIRYILFENPLKALNFLSTFNQVNNATLKKIYIQTADIVGENAFLTMQNVISMLDSGKLRQNSDYDVRFNDLLARSMPSYPTLSLENGKSFQILIGTRMSFYRYTKYHCLLDSVYKDKIIISNFTHPKRSDLKLFVVLKEGDFSVQEIVNNQQAMQLINDRIDFFIDKTYEMEQEAKKLVLKENEILEIIFQNLDFTNRLKEISISQIEPLRKEIPDIMQSWVYYNQFVKQTGIKRI
ncbi:Protein of uncharacterised function (DUF2972) [Campylobacter sputorum subsp. bubulus]|uniref:Protein of uncharacterized function (DUF2972) n=1 Tax=Campylobacter sputorum subsp. sputorum TaxID=32024 RepID=A0A381DJS7_9BACT|nr:DUF2972 domain-containing protein [Campylobacter sputorum]ASM35763.1 DUF2972 domain protein [Campylobacter sputorum aubsp. sputorum RM3237]KAB0581468.1 DUF2972 domain-containing protein [Campylobacter sputorum subsp. sputorum]QEL05953.1 DUF2972 domain-containing protein [Campylobacter sputorum subsp. sputorum]SUX09050.1 Protein of uncharacterised function (DUF2972) [Campylobacter sputorum subsp. bubulus]SUX10741.1 Protein of uncharacterised function (DUF2972) [Campylobacter sputorum subsp. 